MNNINTFNEYINESKLQDDYREFFSNVLCLHGVKSPMEFKNNKDKSKEFYDDIRKGWSKGNGLTDYGKELMKKCEEENKKSS